MPTLVKSMIAGKQSTQSKTIEVLSPFDQSLLANIETSDSNEVDQALATSHALFRDKKGWLSKEQRLDILEKTIVLMQQHAEELSLEAAREGGKPLVDSNVEVARAIDSIRICIDCLRNDSTESIPMGINGASAGKLSVSIHEPIGVVVAISAFNHPLNLIAHQVGPAIASGCPVIVKPAAATPLSCFRFVEMLRQAGLPDEWCQALVTSDREASTQLATDSRVAFLSFVGSANVGWMLRSKLAPGTRCALEHGGAAPVIVTKDADIDFAIPKLLKGGFYHAGQVCVSVQRIFVHESLATELAERLAQEAQTLSIGDPTCTDTDVGPLINPKEVQRVSDWVNEAVAEGAQLLGGGNQLSDSCFECTVLLNPSLDSKVSTQEIFGPVICVYSYNDIEDAIQQANNLPYSFQAAIFAKNIDETMYLFKNLDASAVMVNEHTAFRVDWMPFAGLRESGLGVGGIPYTFEDMQIQKMMVINSNSLL